MSETIVKKPSVEKPWLKLFPEEAVKSQFPRDTVYNVVKATTEKSPNSYALNFYGNRITRAKFMEEVDIAAAALESLGIKKGDVVACNSATLAEMIILIYASNKIGATVLAIDPRRTASFTKKMIEESKAKIFFTIDLSYFLTKTIIPDLDVVKTIIISPNNYLPPMLKFLKKLTDKKIDIEYSDDLIDWKTFLNIGKGKTSTTVEYGENDVVAITFTGGTTGDPKGVMLTNDGFNSVYHSFLNSGVPYTNGHRFLNIIPAFSSYGVVASLHMPLAIGMEVVIIPKFDVNKVGYYIKKFRPNHTLLVPAHYEMLMNSKEMKNFDLSFFKTAGTGGDTMNVGLEDKLNKFLEDHGAKGALSQGYGMSEVSSAISCYCNGRFKSLSVGTPLLNSVVSVFKPGTTEELGYNEEGEICLAGAGVMAGYFNNQEETDKVMWKHPDGQIWVHSGDIGYMDEEGYIFIKGRIKRMITRFDGHKIFPTTIEDAITTHPQVESCAVVDVEDKDHAQGRLALAVIKLLDGADKNSVQKDLDKIIEADLEERGRPSFIDYVDEMPHTTMGKIDYAKLGKEYAEKDVSSLSV